MIKRKRIATKTRFEIFKRDGFICQYCGAHPPEALLEVDHILAVAAGGSNDTDNLITACDRCNRGKGAADLNIAPMSLEEKAELVGQREEQLRGYQEILEAKRQRIEAETWEVMRELGLVKRNRADRAQLQSVKRFIGRLGFHQVMDAAEIARSRRIYNSTGLFRYFCGVCWHKITDQEAGSGS